MRVSKSGSARRRTPAHRILVLGGGPIGLETALYATHLGFDVNLVEAGGIGANVLSWGHVCMFSPWAMNCSPLGQRLLTLSGYGPFKDGSVCPTGRQYVDCYLTPLARSIPLAGRLHVGTRVIGIGRAGLFKGERIGDPGRGRRRFRVLTAGRKGETVFEADTVIDATGTYGQHRYLGDGGIPATGELAAGRRIEYGPVNCLGVAGRKYAGRRILLIGGGYSAATSAVGLAALARRQPRTRVVWVVRRRDWPPVTRFHDDPLPSRDRLAREANAIARNTGGGFAVLQGAAVEAIRPGKGGAAPLHVVIMTTSGPRRARFDRIIANVGYRPDRSIYRELQFHECHATEGPVRLAAALLANSGGDCLSQPSASDELLATTEPGFFVLGSKSYGRNPNFLLQTGFEQIRTLFAGLTRRPRLDLYDRAGRGSGPDLSRVEPRPAGPGVVAL